MKIRRSEEVIAKANDLLMMNYEAEKMFSDAQDLVKDDKLKTFFRQLAFERNDLARALRKEIIKLGASPESFDKLNRLSQRYHIIWKTFRPLLNDENPQQMLDQVIGIKRWSIENYNGLLQEINLSLSLCKLLVAQRDLLHSKMNAITVKEDLVTL